MVGNVTVDGYCRTLQRCKVRVLIFACPPAQSQVATQPSAGAHGQTKRRPGPLRIVEDDENGGCSWCPLVVDEREEDRQAFVGYWRKGENFRQNKRWAQALQLFTQGVVANPSDANCWIGLSRVRAKSSFKKAL